MDEEEVIKYISAKHESTYCSEKQKQQQQYTHTHIHTYTHNQDINTSIFTKAFSMIATFKKLKLK